MPGSPQSEDHNLSELPGHAIFNGEAPRSGGASDRGGRNGLEEGELEAALQLLLERAQYITGATGAALALPQGDEMVCRASAGACAPPVGARLQVHSGLTGESIGRRQLLRCDNAEADPRVNLETCRTLGIASIVVLPLMRRTGEVRGLFELFSDHAYAFEERDLGALERMAALTITALDLAEEQGEAVTPAARARQMKPASSGVEVTATFTSVSAEVPEASAPEAAAVPEAMRRIRKCAACGFPVSEGRKLCLDCEGLERRNIDSEKGAAQETTGASEGRIESAGAKTAEHDAGGANPFETEDNGPAESFASLAHGEILPPFLTNPQLVEESWLARHLNLLAFLVLVAAILVAAVVFFR